VLEINTCWAREERARTWKKILMYWSESSLGGIFEVPLASTGEEEGGREGWEKVEDRISAHILPDS
jgi:hypothetical protein